ncbi:PhzF family phenazine biosynthesis protein [Nocardia terpenica]|nr:PhzF family phenazine biosynthesis protein [Nocardia terpenica]
MVGTRVTIVHACQRDGEGGSPTAVIEETAPLIDAERQAIPAAVGTSHAVFIRPDRDRSVSLRFFTATGELPACGHGTVAALALLAERAGAAEYETVLRAGGRTFPGRAVADGNRLTALFDPGPVELSTPTDIEPVLAAVGIDRASGCRIASVGRPRLLVRVPDRAVLAGLAPDTGRLRDACDRLGLLGCYVYSAPASAGRAAARMFAPSIGVPEDIANVNSTACLAAHLSENGIATVEVDMGDALGHRSTIVASARPGPAIEVGGAAAVVAQPISVGQSVA